MKATTRAGKKALEKKEPKIIENRKKSIFIKGHKFPQEMTKVWDDLCLFRHGENTKMTHNNDFLPFEDITPIEEMCKKMDASLFAFFSHNKRRPNNIVFGRMYDGHVLDLHELGVENIDSSLPKLDIAPGEIPTLIFQGDLWETEHSALRSFLMDFFVGDLRGKVDPEQIHSVLVFTAVEEPAKILLRHYRLSDKALVPTSPSFDLVKRRKNQADLDTLTSSFQKPPQEKKKQNVTKDALGREVGRVFVGKRELGNLRMRKFTGLPKKNETASAQNFDTE